MSVTASQLVAKVSTEGVDASKNQLKSMGQAAQETSSGFKSMLGNALSFASGQAIFNAGAQAVGFLKDQMVDSVKVAMDHEEVMKQTADAIKSTGGASGMTTKSIEDLAASLEKTTYFGKDTTETGENLLLTFTGIGKDVFPQATKTMLDMSKAMGQDVKGTAIMMGKALNDPAQGLTALTRVGVTFSEQEKQQIQTMMAHNDVAGAQKIMLKELQTEFGGSADAGSSFAGKMTILTNRFNDVKEKVGEAVIPILSNLAGTVSDKIMPALDNFGGWFSGTAVPALQHFGDEAGKAGKFLSDTFGKPLSDLKNSVAPLVKDFTDWATKNDILGKAMGGVKNALKDFFFSIAGGIENLSKFIKFLQDGGAPADILKAVLIGIGAAIAAIQIGAFLATVPALIAGFLAWAGAAGAAAIATIEATGPILAIGAGIALVVAGIILAVQHWGDISKWLQDRWSGITGFFGGIWANIQGFFGGTGGWIHDHLVAPFQNALGTIGGVFSAIAKLISDATALNFGAIPGDLHSLGIPGFASGTDFAPGGVAWVGERGPELAYLPRGTRVIPNSQLSQMQSSPAASGSWPPGTPIYFQIDGQTFARLILPPMTNQIRHTVGQWGV